MVDNLARGIHTWQPDSYWSSEGISLLGRDSTETIQGKGHRARSNSINDIWPVTSGHNKSLQTW